MLFCDRLSVEAWSPDFSSSGSANPVWTRARCDGVELCNSLEGIDWSSNPIQVQICDACGITGCASGSYIHLSAMRSTVFWTTPRREDASQILEGSFLPATALARFGAVAFPASAWDSLRVRAPEVPEINRLAAADGRAIRDAWIVASSRPASPGELVSWLRGRLLGTDTLSPGPEFRWTVHWEHFMEKMF
ncbi:MAG: hypothetical protein JOZ48_09025 [Acidobacteriaceae bacterium]|nr:hypothetical protein [Acidobacteriaceae bacterium]